MARTKSTGGTKASAIRDALAANPKATTKEIIEQLASKGVKVSANHVYILKSKTRRRASRQRRDAAVAASRQSGNNNPVQAVMQVKKLAEEMGGLKILKQLVDVLSM
ncbi:MAG: hypothetical protein ACJ8C4_03270 [Gemmataceae bacterium]